MSFEAVRFAGDLLNRSPTHAQVDLTMAGHDHIYERTCPVYKKNCLHFDGNGTAWGPVHVVMGNAGYKLSWGANPSLPAYWSTVALEHGFLRCDVNGTVFHCEVSRSSTTLSTSHIAV